MTSNSDYTNDGDYGGEYAAPKWFEKISEDPKTLEKVSDQVLIELKEEAKKILDSEIANYNIKNAKTNTDYRWMKTVMMKGTISDKIAAYTVLIQDNPVYNLETIRNVIGMVKVGKKKECVAVIETLTELFLSDLLRPNEKLRLFYDRPLSQLGELSSGNAITRRKYLSHWYFEDQLKEAYHTFVQALNTAAHDTVDSNKEKAVAAMSSLLAGNPEQEKNLLSHIINKLGDPSQKVASKAMYCLTQVLKQHSNMQGVVLKEIEKLLFRANIGHKAQYYSLCFISQFYLCAENPEVAQKLIEVYFSFFKKCIKEGDVDSRMMSVLLIGVNRAYPYANLDLNSISEHINTMYRVVHVSNLNVALNALSLLFQVSQCADSVNDRFYSALYRKLMDSKLPSCTNQAILLNLLYKSMLRDDKNERIIAFIKRLLQIALIVQSNFACGIIFLISQLLAKKTGLSLMHLKIVEPEIKIENDSDDEEKYTDVKDDDEEKYTDVKDEDDGDNQKETGENDQNVVGWVHRQDSQKVKVERKEKNYYDPFARNPLFAQAQLSAYCELLELKNHYHPSVRLFAEHMLEGKKIVYSGDPLKDFTLIRFLERFVFKNPKKVDEMPSASTFSKRKYYQPQGIRSIAVLSNDFLSQSEKNIPVDELFLYTYMRKRYKDVKIKEDDDESDLESVASEEFEDMLSKMSGLKDDEDEDELDFMNEVGTNIRKQKMANKKQKKKSDDGSEEESDDDGDEDEDEDLESHISDDDEEAEDLSMNSEDRELLGDLSEDDDDELFLGDDDDEDDLMLDSEDEPKVKAKPKAKKGSGSVFAAAEEFASLLEDEGNSKIAPGSSNQMENSDKAGTKQLDWEDKRNRWIKGYNSALGKGGKGKPFKGGNDKGQKRPNKFGQSHKNKKHKK